jgi:hypothetical protein
MITSNNLLLEEAATMNIVRSRDAFELLQEALSNVASGDEKLVNASFMISPAQKRVIELLARENRLSQGVVLRVIMDEWMEKKLQGRS